MSEKITEPSADSLKPPDYVRAWAIAHGCEVHTHHDTGLESPGHPGWYWADPTESFSVCKAAVPPRDSGDYFKGLVMAAEFLTIVKADYGGGYKYFVRWNDSAGKGPDQVSALIAAILESKGGGK